MKWFLMLMLGLISFGSIGCEVDADTDDDGAELKVDDD